MGYWRVEFEQITLNSDELLGLLLGAHVLLPLLVVAVLLAVRLLVSAGIGLGRLLTSRV